MELLHRNEEDQRCGFLMRITMRWHRLQKKKEKIMNAQWEDEVLKENEYQNEYLMTETLSEDKRSQDLKFDILCMLAGETYEDGQFSDIVTKKKEGNIV